MTSREAGVWNNLLWALVLCVGMAAFAGDNGCGPVVQITVNHHAEVDQ